LLLTVFAERYIDPAGEDIRGIPGALTVTQEH
jgi:hypothetical protein